MASTGGISQLHGKFEAFLSDKSKRSILAWGAIFPAILILVLYRTIPLLWTFLLSFQELSFLGETTWVGTANYERVLTDDVFIEVLVQNLLLLGTIPVGITIALGIALLLNKQFFGSDSFRSLIFLPYVLMMVGVAVIWQYMFKTNGGVVNFALLQLGIIESNISWTADGTWGLVAIFIVHVWKTVGLYLVVLLAGLQTIPRQVYEVSRIDGASRRQRFQHITLPLLKPTIGVCILIGMTLSFKMFDLILTMTGGGPGDSTQILITYLYEQAFTHGRFGYGAVLTIILFVMMLALIAFARLVQRRSYE